MRTKCNAGTGKIITIEDDIGTSGEIDCGLQIIYYINVKFLDFDNYCVVNF